MVWSLKKLAKVLKSGDILRIDFDLLTFPFQMHVAASKCSENVY